MGRFIQNPNSKGSLKNLQVAINEKKKYLDCEILKDAEYRDEDFLKNLGILSKIEYPLSDFWPKNGPQWDALGVSRDEIILVEAKANIPEMVSPGSRAKFQSRKKIENSLWEVQKYLNISNSTDWTGTFYQYANRIAHLYYLREINEINANLLFIYFINDKTVDGPENKSEWLGAIQTMECYLGLDEKE
jgi:hypothetical protein